MRFIGHKAATLKDFPEVLSKHTGEVVRTWYSAFDDTLVVQWGPWRGAVRLDGRSAFQAVKEDIVNSRLKEDRWYAALIEQRDTEIHPVNI